MLREVRNHHRAIGRQHHIKDGVLAGQLAQMRAAVGFDPHAALVPEAESGRIGMKVFGRQLGNRVVAGFRRGIQDSDRTKNGKSRSFMLSVCSDGFRLCLSHLNSRP